MSGLFDKLAVPLFGLAAAVSSGCYAGDVPISPQEKDDCTFCESIDIPQRTEPMVITEPGTYKVIPGDVFKGSLGVDLRIDEVVPEDKNNGGYIKGSYINSNGEIEFESNFSLSLNSFAFFDIGLFGLGESKLKFTDNIDELSSRCEEKLKETVISDVKAFCSSFLPTKERKDETLIKSKNGYYGKVNSNDKEQKILAKCAAYDLDSGIENISTFLDLPKPWQGASQVYVIAEGNIPYYGETVKNVSTWIYEKNTESLLDAIEECKNKINNSNYSKGNHEVVHLVVWDYFFGIPGLFNEGLANFLPTRLNGNIISWNEPNSVCVENGFKVGYETIPYKKYYETEVSNSAEAQAVLTSGECFWTKVNKMYGDNFFKLFFKELKIIKETSVELPKHDDLELSLQLFEQALINAGKNYAVGFNLNDYKQWGLGE